MEPCNDCRGTNMIEYHGDYTCKDCGLVKYIGMVDTDASHYYDEYESFRESCGKGLLKTELSRKERTLLILKHLIFRVDVDKSVKQFAYQIVVESEPTLNELKRKSEKLALVCLSLYYSCVSLKRGLPMDYISEQIGINTTLVWNVLPKLLPIWSKQRWYMQIDTTQSCHSDKLTRIVYSLDFVKNTQKVLTSAKAIYTKVHALPRFITVKSHSLISCCIFMACQLDGCTKGMKKQAFCKQLAISLPTINAIEVMICEHFNGNN